jgi:hypothetical protein
MTAPAITLHEFERVDLAFGEHADEMPGREGGIPAGAFPAGWMPAA